MGTGGPITVFAYICEWCGASVYRRHDDHRALPPPGERTCGMCKRPKGYVQPKVEHVVVGKCEGCGADLVKPAHRRGRNPRYCPKCRDERKFALPPPRGGRSPPPPKINAKGPAAARHAARARREREGASEENDRISRIKAIVGGTAHGR